VAIGRFAFLISAPKQIQVTFVSRARKSFHFLETPMLAKGFTGLIVGSEVSWLLSARESYSRRNVSASVRNQEVDRCRAGHTMVFIGR
jgi:hypothetical protein